MRNALNAVALCIVLACGPLLEASPPEIVWQFDTAG
jgi:hypothetical protein